MTLFVSRPASSPRDVTYWVNRLANVLLIGGFLVAITVPLLGVFRGNASKDIEESERRRAAAFPTIEYKKAFGLYRPNSKSIKDFPHQFEKWFNDRIGYRRRLIQLYQMARHQGWTPSRLSLAGVGEAGQVPVVIGREGWLYYQDDGLVDDLRGTSLFSERELEQWRLVLTERRDWLAKRGIRYLFVVAPDKHTIYPEFLPRSFEQVADVTRLDQLADYLKQHGDLEFIDLRASVLAAKSKHRVFHKTDTHWNAYGAFAGYQEMMQPIQAWFPQVAVPTDDDYELVTHDCDLTNVREASPWVGMDLVLMLNSPVPYREEVIDLVPRRNELAVGNVFQGDPTSDAERTIVHRHETGQLAKVFVLHDSFMMAMAPFLTPNCREVIYHWSTQFPAEQIEQAKPVLVIQQIVQRKLMTNEPSNPPQVSQELQAGP